MVWDLTESRQRVQVGGVGWARRARVVGRGGCGSVSRLWGPTHHGGSHVGTGSCGAVALCGCALSRTPCPSLPHTSRPASHVPPSAAHRVPPCLTRPAPPCPSRPPAQAVRHRRRERYGADDDDASQGHGDAGGVDREGRGSGARTCGRGRVGARGSVLTAAGFAVRSQPAPSPAPGEAGEGEGGRCGGRKKAYDPATEPLPAEVRGAGGGSNHPYLRSATTRNRPVTATQPPIDRLPTAGGWRAAGGAVPGQVHAAGGCGGWLAWTA